MTLTTENNTKEYTANGSTTEFAYDFLILDEEDMEVYLDGVLQASGYTVSGVGDVSGGNVTFSVAPAADVRVSLYRVVDLTQEVDYQPYDPFPAETHEGALDKLTMLVQQVYERTLRAITAPIGGDPTVDYTLPQYDAGKGIMWDASTKTLTNSDDALNGIVTAAQAARDAAQAAQSAAESAESGAQLSETNAGTSETNAGLAQTAAEAAQTAAEAAQTAAELAETGAEAAEAAAGLAQTGAETAETNAGLAQTAAEAAQTAAELAETGAEAAEAKAEKWAEELEDTEVETGKYSALHHAAKAADSASLAATYAVQKFTSTSAPGSGDGSDGDLWFQYS